MSMVGHRGDGVVASSLMIEAMIVASGLGLRVTNSVEKGRAQ